MSGVRHLYVHLPFCASRCGYCDFVTVVGRSGQHAAYVDALLEELTLRRELLAPRLESVFLGGGTPTFTAAAELDGKDLSEWVRDRLRRLAKQELEQAGRPIAFLSPSA